MVNVRDGMNLMKHDSLPGGLWLRVLVVYLICESEIGAAILRSPRWLVKQAVTR